MSQPNQTQQQIIQTQTVQRIQVNQNGLNSSLTAPRSSASPQLQQQGRYSQVSQPDNIIYENQNQNKTNKAFSFFLLCLSVALSIFFYLITKDFTGVDDCKRLYVSSEINEYVWYYNIFLQIYYITLVIGSNHWRCFNFQNDLPGLYRFFNGFVLICILGCTVALQISLNYQEKCGSLGDQIRTYLTIVYIAMIILIVYLALYNKKQSSPTYLPQTSSSTQQPVVQQQFTYTESQRLNDQNQNNYSTFNNNIN